MLFVKKNGLKVAQVFYRSFLEDWSWSIYEPLSILSVIRQSLTEGPYVKDNTHLSHRLLG